MSTFHRDLATQLAIGSVFAVENRQDLLKNHIQESVATPEQWYEALLQTYLFAGFPCALQSLTSLSQVTGTLRAYSFNYDVGSFDTQGQITCKKVYGDVYDKLRTTLQGISPELEASMIIEGYGKILSRSALSLIYREVAIVAILRQNGWHTQNISHTRGALRLGIQHDQLEIILKDCFTFTVDKGVRPPIIQG